MTWNSEFSVMHKHMKNIAIKNKKTYEKHSLAGFVKKMAVVMMTVALAVSTVGCSVGHEDYSGAGTIMGTIVTAGYRAKGTGNGEKVWDMLNQAGIELEKDTLSRREDTSVIYAINASAGNTDGYALTVSEVSSDEDADMEKLADYIELCMELSERTGGAFDITVGALAELWGIDEAAMDADIFSLPTDNEVMLALGLCGYDKVTFDNNIINIPQGMILDLGAVGKGIYLADAYGILKEYCDYGVVAAGGSILTYGYKEAAKQWHVAIADPFGEKEYISMLSLSGSYFISTSGDYERYVEYEGVRYHHILDTKTGYPADSGLCSVTVVIPADKKWDGYFQGAYESLSDIDISGFMSDAITTAIFVMGEDEGMELAASYDLDVLMIKNDGAVVMSDGMCGYIE